MMQPDTPHFHSSDRALPGWRIAWFAILLLGAALRFAALSWQPLWWDEGYSIFFATEPLPTMLSLTGQDIHPPLYYTLLHLWFRLLGDTGPESARIFSALIGILTLPILAWASRSLLPQQRAFAWLATLLLAINPIHIYYSQEVRMYGLALMLSLVATTSALHLSNKLTNGQKPYAWLAAYVISASLGLLTLYYLGFLLLAIHLWAIVNHRRAWQRQRWFLAAALLILLCQLPWWFYALPRLLAYVADKVIADQDLPLPLWDYLWRHWLAFFAAHLPAPQSWLEVTRMVAVGLLAPLLLFSAYLTRVRQERDVTPWLLFLVIVPASAGYLVNLYYPFFPEGGERLLLQLLPYLILLVALLTTRLLNRFPALATLILALCLAASAIGNLNIFTVPRYTAHDYRPIIADIMQRSRANDTILALFPWQVGYWRAYSPRNSDGTWLQPQPAPVDQRILRWDEGFAQRLDQALTQGTIWFPMPLSFGSTLPDAIEKHLRSHSRNLEDRWYTPATRLTAWVTLPEGPNLAALDVAYQDQVTLQSGSIAPLSIASANQPLAVDLCWQPAAQRSDLRATLRLMDSGGRTWAKRDITPLAAYASTDPATECLERLAMTIPLGLPPATYQLLIGIGPVQGDQLYTPITAETPLVELGQIEVTSPTEPVSPYRLPMQVRLATPLVDSAVAILGYSGPNANNELLAGDELDLTLAMQSMVAQPPQRDLYISLQDSQGNSVTAWQGWPLPQYPTQAWAAGTLSQVPLQFYLPPDMAAGEYTLVAALLDPATSEKSAAATLTSLQVIRRPASFTQPPIEHVLSPVATFGTHARLVGYDLHRQGATLQLALTWQVEQPLLPPHHIFAHLYDAHGQRIDQSDGPPLTASGSAPTGSWLPQEFLTTLHSLTPPPASSPQTIQVGLYLPANGQRLPVSVNGAVTGDSVTISLPTAP